MSTLPPLRPLSFERLQMYPPSRGAYHPTAAGPELEQPKVLIAGDIRLCVTESQAALRPITGHYRIETAGMREPLFILWLAEGRVLSREARSTNIAFDARGARAGETRIYVVAAQVVESGLQGRVVLSGTFVRVVVTGDDPVPLDGSRKVSSQPHLR